MVYWLEKTGIWKSGRMEPMKTTIAAMDFGTSKIVTLVAENGGNARCDIVGAGVAEYDGFLPDGWNNPGDLNQKILDCIRDAAEQSHRKSQSEYRCACCFYKGLSDTGQDSSERRYQSASHTC